MLYNNVLRRSTNPAVDTSPEYAQLFSAMSMFQKFIDTVADVVVTDVSEDGKYVKCKQVAYTRMENGTDLPQLEYSNIPVVQMNSSGAIVKFKVNIGDIGIIFARKFDIDMPEKSDAGVSPKPQKSGRIMSFSQGFFVPLSFSGNSEVDFHLQSGDCSVKINEGNIEVSVTGNATVNAARVDLNATQVFLGGEQSEAGEVAKPIARHGDNVVMGTTVVGTIQSSSEVVKSL